MVLTQPAAISSAFTASGLLTVMVPSASMIWPPPFDFSHSSALQVRPS